MIAARRDEELLHYIRFACELACVNRDKTKENKDPQEMLGDFGLQKIVCWSQVETGSNLESIWKDLVKAKKSQQLAILQ
jgi:hypothetical protein